MKICHFIIAATCCLAVSCLTARSQVSAELKAFQDAAGSGSILFRGKQASSYDRRANGNPYWYSDTFVPGEIVFEGNFYDDILVNVDAVAGLALVRKEDTPIAISLNPGNVSVIRTDASTFVGIGPGHPSLPEGFYEVFGSGPEMVYKHVSKKLQTSTQYMNGDPIGYYDSDYNPEYTSYFALTKTYYFMDGNGVFSRIRGRKSLIRKFPERRGEIRRSLADKRLDLPGADFDACCREVLRITAR